MATDLETAPGAKIPEPPPPAGHKRRFSLPSAYTILFALIVVTALATWIIPAGRYALDPNGSPMPGTYHEVDSSPARIRRSTASTGSKTPPPATSTSTTRAACSAPSTSRCSSSSSGGSSQSR